MYLRSHEERLLSQQPRSQLGGVGKRPWERDCFHSAFPQMTSLLKGSIETKSFLPIELVSKKKEGARTRAANIRVWRLLEATMLRRKNSCVLKTVRTNKETTKVAYTPRYMSLLRSSSCKSWVTFWAAASLSSWYCSSLLHLQSDKKQSWTRMASPQAMAKKNPVYKPTRAKANKNRRISPPSNFWCIIPPNINVSSIWDQVG